MCDFCDEIYNADLLYATNVKSPARKEAVNNERERFRKRVELLEREFQGNYMIFDQRGIHILAETGEPFQEGVVEKISYCPYCGKRLQNG